MVKIAEFITKSAPKTLIIGIYSPYNPTENVESYFEEFKNLVHSNGVEYQHEIFMRLRTIDPATFITKGKLDEIIKLCETEEIEEIFISEPLSIQQERNLSKLLHARIIDRTQLILEIFEKGAVSAEGKLQIKLALFQHWKGRLAGRGISMSQQSGKTGTRGPGETAKEKEMQHIEHLMVKIRRDLEKLQQVRETQRKRRLSSNIPHICLIGYTNAGKSTVLNALTHSNVLAEDKLFATLDTTTRELFINSKKKGVISDTVGFIQQLPHHLIEAFKSTLSELQYAHLLIHVIDASDNNWQTHIKVVHEILQELDVDKPMLYVFNKIDKVENIELLQRTIGRYNPHVLVSSLSAEGIQPLIDFLDTWLPAPYQKSQ